MALTQRAAVLAVVFAMATVFMMTRVAAATESPEELARCQEMAGNVTTCTLKLDPKEPAAPTTPECCSLIMDAHSTQKECLCGAYLGIKLVSSESGRNFENYVKECGITSDFFSSCAEIQKQLEDEGILNKGAAGKTVTAGVFGVLLVAALTMLF